MDKYLSQPDVPDFLKYPVVYPSYNAEVVSQGQCGMPDSAGLEKSRGACDISDVSGVSDKYLEYFRGLNYDGHMFEGRSMSATADYRRKHWVLTPRAQKTTKSEKSKGTKRVVDNPTSHFSSFVNLPSIFSDAPLTGIAYHAAASLNSNVYIFGGLVCMSRHSYECYLENLTDHFRIAPKNIKMVFEYDVPVPLSRDKLMNLASVPNEYLMVYMPDSNTFRHVIRLQGSRVKPVLCSGMVTPGRNSLLVYGGIELRTRITRPDPDHVIVTRTLHPNNDLWRFDALSSTFHQLRILVHPTYSTSLPVAIGRFGHSCTCLPVAEGPHSQSRYASCGFSSGESESGSSCGIASSLAVIFIMGGYKMSASGNSYVALNDLWKCDIFWDQYGFKDEVVCCPIGKFDLIGDQYELNLDMHGVLKPTASAGESFSGLLDCHGDEPWPKPRGFFSMQLVDRSSVERSEKRKDCEKKMNRESTRKHPEMHFERLSRDQRHPEIRSEQLSRGPSKELFREHLKQRRIPGKSPSKTASRSNSKSPESCKSHKSLPDSPENLTKNSSTDSSITPSFSKSPSPSLSLQQESTSPLSVNPEAAHTSMMPALHNKILLINGGSCEVHIKVRLENGECMFRKKVIFGDSWWFDFRQEKWIMMVTNKAGKQAELPICGHECTTNMYHMLIMGGISRDQFAPSVFETIPESGIPKGKELLYQSALKIVEDFIKPEADSQDNRCFTSTPEGFLGIHTIRLGKRQDKLEVCYRTYILDLERFSWRPIDFYFVRCLASFVDKDAFLMFACSPMVRLESKLLLIGGDVRKVCRKNYRQRNHDLQNVYGGNVTELYTSFMRM